MSVREIAITAALAVCAAAAADAQPDKAAAPSAPAATAGTAARAAAPYQWVVKIDRGKDKAGRERPPAEIGLWIPPSCRYVKGIVVGAQTLLERSFLQEPLLRECAARNNLAMAFPTWPDAAILEKLAEASGYGELKAAPFVTVGHSTGGIGARNAAYVEPKRAIAVLHFHSGNYHDAIPGKDLSLAGVPFLAVNGEF